MLKKLTLRNFRSHQKTVLEFVKGINIIIGESLHGKSNIVRGIIWLLTNRPAGFKFHSDFTDETFTEVAAEFYDSDIAVSLHKTSTAAAYKVGDQVFKGFGQSVPDAVSDLMNLSDINLQKQLDKQFLILSSPGEAARVINRITQMEESDRWTSHLTTLINSENKEIRLLVEQKQELEEEVRRYNYIEDFENKLIVLESQAKVIDEKQETLTNLQSLLNRHKIVEDEIILFKKKIEGEDAVNQALELVTHISELLDMLDVVDDLVSTERKLAARKVSLKPEKVVNEILNTLESLKGKNKALNSINEALSTYKSYNEKLDTYEWKLEELKDQFRQWLETGLKGRCPICRNKLGKEDAASLIGLF